MMIKKRFLVIFALTTSYVMSFGQVKDSIPKDSIRNYNLEEVVVSATRTKRQLSSLPLQVQLISRKEIEKSRSSRLSDLLSEQTGIILVPGHTGGGKEGVQMQGIDAQYTMILIDGVPLVGRSVGTLDLNRISVGDVEQVEIVKGASSSLYGSEALGGVINIITSKGKKGFYTDLNYRRSRFETNDASLRLGYNKEKYGVQFFSNYYNSAGYSLIEKRGATVHPFENFTNRIKANYQIQENTDIEGSFRYYKQNQDYETRTGRNISFVDEWNAHFKLNHKYNDKWSSFLEIYGTQYYTNEKRKDKETNKVLRETDFDERAVRSEIRTTFKPSLTTTYMGGIGWNYSVMEQTIFKGTPNLNSLYSYFQYEVFFWNKVNLITGLRYDYNSEYSSQLSPKIALKYDFNDKISLKGSVGYGFKAPSFGDLYYNFTNPSVGYSVFGSRVIADLVREMDSNGEIEKIIVPLDQLESEKLNPESSVSFNFGVNYQPIKSLKIGISYFRNDIKNLISSQTVAKKKNGRDVYGFYNVSKFYTHGWEADVNYNITPQIRLSAGYQLLFAKDKETKEDFKKGRVIITDKEGNTTRLGGKDYFGLANRSRHSANAKLYVEIPEWGTDFNIRWIYRGKYPLIDTNKNKYLDAHDDFVSGYSLVNVAVNKEFLKHYTVGFGVENLFDYKDIENISTLPGRMFFFNFNIKLDNF